MSAHTPSWSVERIDFGSINREQVRHDETTRLLATCASFVESGSDLYTRNLIEYYTGDEEAVEWLSKRWEKEELQHGRAMRTYVEYVWPEFPWQQAFQSFFAEYSATCRMDELEPTKALEMAARCVVETGTVSYYRALAKSTSEPVLKQLALLIAADELRHYKYFLKFFKRYRVQERPSRWATAGAIVRRLKEFQSDDGECAVRHVVTASPGMDASQQERIHAEFRKINRVLRRNIQMDLVVKMLLQPLCLPPLVRNLVMPAIVGSAKLALQRG